jgi:hypothetical protein
VKNLALAFIAAILGSIAGWLLRPQQTVELDARSVPTAIRMSSPSDALMRDASTLADMRAIVREEISAALETSGRLLPVAASGIVQREPAVDAQAQRDAIEVVNGSVASGRWRNEDRQLFRENVAKLSAAQREALLRKLAVGMNDGTIEVLTEAAPL